jgi:hypothetical protein
LPDGAENQALQAGERIRHGLDAGFPSHSGPLRAAVASPAGLV